MTILFIFFGGHNMANEFWSFNPIENKKTNFISNLKTIGDIYMFQPSYYNICHYDKKNSNLQKYYNSELKFNLQDISFNKQAQNAHNEINKLKKYDTYIIICSSIGIHYAIELQKLLNISLIISIEGSSIGENAKIKFANSIKKYEDIYASYDEKKIDILKKNITSNNIYNDIYEFIICKLNSQIDFTLTKFNIPSLHFQNLIITNDNQNNDKNTLKIDTVSKMELSDPLYKCIWIINKTHQPFWVDPDLIFKYIKNEINCHNLLTHQINDNDYDVVLYHGSPVNNIKKLRGNSYVTLFPHIAYIMGLYHTKTNKTWNDDDLKEPYDFGKKIYFKKNNKPDGVPILYKLKTKWTNIIIKNNFPYEMILKNETDVEIINNKKIIYDKIKNSEKLFDYYDKIGLDI